ncbi:MAG: prephenate dehydrogenase/arogenate dehydrogenase family protein [bacterium]
MDKKLTIGVIGLGLIGGSILKSLKSQGFSLLGVSRSKETIDKVINSGITDNCSTDLNILKSADIVFVCTPISKINSTIEDLSEIVNPNCIITDAASIKGAINDFVEALPKKINFIGGHPMAGTENKGFEHAPEHLYNGAKWVLTPQKTTKQEDLDLLISIIEKMGAIPIITEAHVHDKAVSLISHMPLLISQTLFGLVQNYPDKEVSQLAMTLAASGFRDMTRIASTNPELAEDMLFENSKNVKNSTEEFVDYLNYMLNMIKNENKQDFLEQIEAIVLERKKMYSIDGKNVYSD